MDIESVCKIEKAKRAMASVLNLIRYRPVATLEEARSRLHFVDQFAVEAFLAINEVEKAEFPAASEHSGTPQRSAPHLRPTFSQASSHAGLQ